MARTSSGWSTSPMSNISQGRRAAWQTAGLRRLNFYSTENGAL